MNKIPELDDLEIEARRLLRYRIPLMLAVVVNFALLIRVPAAQLAAERSAAPAHGSPAPLDTAPPPGPAGPSESCAAQPELAPPQTRPADNPRPTLLDTLAPADRWTATLRAFEAAWRAQQPAVRALLSRAATAQPASDPPDLQSTSRRLVLRNPLDNGGPVRLLVNGRVQELMPGESHEFTAGASWDVQFHRGDSFGNEQCTLAPGDYRFVVTEQGWHLERVAP